MNTPLLPPALSSLLVLLVVGGAFAQDQEKGRVLAVNLCAHCHMNEGQGEKRTPMEVPGFSAIANRPNQSMRGIVTWLRSVPPMMPNHHLSQDEMYDLAAFILSLRQESGSGSTGTQQLGGR
jgi:cytochrome c553